MSAVLYDFARDISLDLLFDNGNQVKTYIYLGTLWIAS